MTVLYLWTSQTAINTGFFRIKPTKVKSYQQVTNKLWITLCKATGNKILMLTKM